MLTVSVVAGMILWDTATGRKIRAFGDEDLLVGASFSPNGKTLAGATWDEVRLWDPSTGKSARTLAGQTRGSAGATLFQDGRTVVSLPIWDLMTGEGLSILPKVSATEAPLAPDRPLATEEVSASMSSDKRLVVTLSDGGNASVWDVASGKRLWGTGWSKEYVLSASFSSGGSRLVTGTTDGFKVWESASGRETLAHLAVNDDFMPSASFSPDGKFIVSGMASGKAKVWDASTGREVLSLHGHKDFVLSSVLPPDGRLIATGSRDRTAKVWDAATGKEALTLTGHRAAVTSVRFSQDGKLIVTASEDGTARIWFKETGREINALLGHEVDVLSADFSPDGRHVITSSSDTSVRVWDAASGKELFARYAFKDGSFVVVTPGGRFDGTGLHHLHWVKGLEVLPLEAFSAKAHTPDLVSRIMKGEKLPPLRFGRRSGSGGQ